MLNLPNTKTKTVTNPIEMTDIQVQEPVQDLPAEQTTLEVPGQAAEGP